MWNRIDLRINTALNRIRKVFRGVLVRVNSTGGVQTVQAKGLAGESLQDAELFQHYGFTSNPLKGTMAVVVPVNGKTSHSIIIATEHATYRLKKLKSGEVALYTDEGSSIILKRGRIIEVNCDEYIVNARNKYQVNTVNYGVTATDKAEFETPLLKGSNEVADGNSTMNKMREIYDEHDHNHGGDAGITDAPNQTM
ncbi:TPA_asm: phage baseplate assembly protein V [Salmonella enterica subsp. houtenae serovar 45:g,z51:-]|uniref:Phage baseplate assembly protein V n=1 Tax=Salmonella enterica subsp. houtenae serovar 45:g,z51:- TaxID=1967611 RepID=A0A736RDI6_SALHO|nr:phage baseplate assembly protein V [Salmonella enterica subsp. houtenae str. CFSAN000557]HAE7766827.1 phage baseplate assembly protein V [Salmonella enterica subsp. houtenae serovar 45:g,z51:-]